ncbi:ribbon-helix-helix protein, CopG family [Vulcanisaeta distributa]|uniref:ribbon-helix-helix protein, CopG family n=1 Tax=Vulcanisaeta distributa TaxID=164451 RepID=UPI001FB23E01|nr:ribbon-helix-helix protein, CopG family [Vulcanisaeta distributa]
MTIRMTDEELKLLDKIANQLNLTRSDAVRKLLSDFKGAVAEAVKVGLASGGAKRYVIVLRLFFTCPGG